MRVTIHQPDFLPWFGFFNKVAKSDVWIVLDHVENNPRDAAFWGRRVRILVNGQPTWLSIPLNRPTTPGAIGVPICEITVNQSSSKNFEKGLRMVQQAYARAPYFRDHGHLVEEWFESSEPSLALRNMRFIESVLRLLGVRTKLVSSSTLEVRSRGTELLVDIILSLGADTYLCGTGAGGYQQDNLFAARGVHLEYNHFVHPIYPQLHTAQFVPGLSILDALFCVPTVQLAEWVLTA